VELSYVMPFVVNTELGAGTGEAFGLKHLQPSQVADAIVHALKHRVVDVWVPRSSHRTQRLNQILPRRLSERIARAMKADRVLMGADKQARAAYELRAARSEPGLEPADEPSRLAS
jgi:short-subunit dehydrogenase